MKIIIIGGGKVGRTLIESFVKEGHDVIVVDKQQKNIEEIVNRFEANGFVGSGLERQILLDAGVDIADMVISCTSHDEVNILCSVLAKRLGAKKTVARVRDPQYFTEMETMRTDLGLDLAFNPERRSALDVAEVLKFPSANRVESFAGGRAIMVEFDITGGNPVIGKSLMEISKSTGSELLFAMIEREDKVLIPRGDFVIQEGDTVSIIATESELTAFCKKLKIFKQRAKSVFIVGGGMIAYYLAKELLNSGVSVKIVEKDKAKCDNLSESLDRVTILFGDGTDQEILNEEGVTDADACVTLTGIDEENILVSLYAKNQKVGKVITKVNNETMVKMAENLGLKTVICPRVSIANHIISFVRSCQTEDDDAIKVLYKLNDKIEAAEFSVGDNFEYTGIPLSELKIKKEALIGGIVRDGKYIIPRGDTVFLKGDRVIVVSSLKQLAELSDIIK